MNDDTSSQPRGRVILTYGRSLMTLSAAQVLSDRNVDVIGCDTIDMTVTQHSRYCRDYAVYRDPDEDPEGFIDDLVAIAEAHAPEDDGPYVLMPVFRETRVISQNAHRFRGVITVAAPPHEAISGVEPKDRLIETAERAGVRAPVAVNLERHDDVEAAIAGIPFPALTKPVEGVGGRGIERHEDREALSAYLDERSRNEPLPILQEFVEGEDYCVCVLCQDGEIVAHMAYRNLQAFPKGTGAGVLRETVDDTPFLQDARALMKTLGWNGVCEIDYRWTGNRDERPCLIEVNARFWAGLFHSIASGIEYPWLWYQLATEGRCDEPREAEIGRKSKVPFFWFLAAAQDAAAHEDYPHRLHQAWENLTEAKDDDRGTFERLTDLAKATFDAPALAHLVKSVMDAHKQGKNSAVDFIPPEDPGAALGALFVASSLIRHGKLPPELKNG
ncbi:MULTISPECIES: carboxylate--amine ligase [Hyphobacterium]|uniref:ATP-grasp domain-containing protein n=1 Tax=Hyphobacterium vulgare TaxID=1736751 RepID=A0ABV6ZT39_9PROT